MKNEKTNPKTRRVTNRVRKILIKNRNNKVFLLDIFFNEKTFKNTTEQTRHKYLITALNLLNCDYLAIKNYNKDQTREHYRAIISTNYIKYLNRITYHWLKSKGTLRHQLLNNENRKDYNTRKIITRLAEIQKNNLNAIASKQIIYSDINKNNHLIKLQETVKNCNTYIAYHKSKGHPTKELEEQRESAIKEIAKIKNKTNRQIANLFKNKEF